MQNEDLYNINVEAFDKQAQLYQDFFMDIDIYNDTYDRFCEGVKKNGKVLELGCGPGNITRYLLRKRPDFTVIATDLAPNMIKLAKINNPAADCRLLDCRAIEQLNEKFDGILCGFCMPYLSKDDCRKLIADATSLLNKGGVFYTSIIEGNNSGSGFEYSSQGVRIYQYYHEESYLTEYLRSSGLAVTNTYRKKLIRANGTISKNLIIVAVK